ncbi:hypothetical protein L6R50_19240 [Myxococcota bacterium]|nr:hypothetical protein [Myxococcota bacterium]
MRTALLAVPFLAAPLLFSGCGNACQQLCDVVADVYESCGKSYGDSEIGDCRSRYASTDADMLATCEYGIDVDRDGRTNFEKDATCETIEGWEAAFAGSGE